MPNVDYTWVREQMQAARVKVGTGNAVLKLLETWETLKLTDNQVKEVLQFFSVFAKGHAVIEENPDEVWVDARPGARPTNPAQRPEASPPATKTDQVPCSDALTTVGDTACWAALRCRHHLGTMANTPKLSPSAKAAKSTNTSGECHCAPKKNRTVTSSWLFRAKANKVKKMAALNKVCSRPNMRFMAPL